MICFEKVSKYVLSDVSLYIPKGVCVGLIGPSGAGKTTLIRLACGLLEADNGNVITLGKNPVKHRGHFGSRLSVFMSGVPLLCLDETVKQGFELIKEVYHIPEKNFSKDYSRLADRLGFNGFDSLIVKNLSLGQRMRAELGASLICRPELLLLDEPNIGLDEIGKAVLCELIKECCERGMTVLLTSHDMTEISKACDRLAVLNGGRLLFYGSEEILKSRYVPTDVMTVTLCGSLPDLDDLPLNRYSVEGNTLTLSYNSNYVTAAEIIKLILEQTEISSVDIKKPDLESVCSSLSEHAIIS